MNNENVQFVSGAGIDYRVEEQKAKDYKPQEAFAFGAVDWKEKTIEEIEANIKATSISQGYTSRCVSEYAGIALEQAEFFESGQRIVFSRRDVYARRFNRPAGGMAMHDLFKIMREGACLESQLPSTQIYENEINQPYDVTPEMKGIRSKYSAGSSFTWNTWTIDDIAQMIQNGTPVCLFWFFNNNSQNEWWNPTPTIKSTVDLFAEDTGRHQASGVDFCMKDGKKYIVVMDSAGQGTGLGTKKNLRLVSEDFFKVRCYGAGFTIDKKNLDYKPTEEIHYTFTRTLKNGMTGDDVMVLQKILILEGCLVLKSPTRYFGGMTEAGVKKLQEKYSDAILKPLGLKNGTGIFANSTRNFINNKYR